MVGFSTCFLQVLPRGGLPTWLASVATLVAASLPRCALGGSTRPCAPEMCARAFACVFISANHGHPNVLIGVELCCVRMSRQKSPSPTRASCLFNSGFRLAATRCNPMGSYFQLSTFLIYGVCIYIYVYCVYIYIYMGYTL